MFGTGSDTVSSLAQGAEFPLQRTIADEGIQQTSNWPLSSGYDWNMSSVHGDSLQMPPYDNIDGGLCWLWDTTWNGFERQ